MATERTCPHGDEHRLQISGTRLREMFVKGEKIPDEFSRPEVVTVLKDYYAGLTG
jgi:sulfate adenylyltransferase